MTIRKALARLIANIDVHAGGLLISIMLLIILSAALKLSEKVEDNVANLLAVFGGGVITLTKATSGKEEDKNNKSDSPTCLPNTDKPEEGGYYIDEE